MALLTLPGSRVVRYCLPVIESAGDALTPYVVTDNLLASLGVVAGMVLVGRGLRKKETPADGSVCVVRLGGVSFAKRVRFDARGRLLLCNDREENGRICPPPVFKAVVLHACACELRGFLCAPVPLDTEVRLATFAEGPGMLRWTADENGLHADTGEMRRWVERFGGNPEDWKGWGWARFLHPEDRDAFMARWNESIETGKAYLNHGRIYLGGEWMEMAVTANPRRDGSGRVVGWSGFIHLEAIESRRRA